MSGRGKGKGGGKGTFGKGGGKGNSSRKWWCFRCWKSDDHLSGQCDEAPRVCAACGMDSAKASLSCGGEKDPTKCMIKGYRPQARWRPVRLP